MTQHYKSDPESKGAHLDRVSQRLQYADFPPQVILETTAGCNIHCSHCAHRIMERPQGWMKMPLWRKIIDEIAQRAPHTEVWPTFYGEALTLKYRLFYMIQYAKRKGLTNLVLNTNGTLLDEEACWWLIDSGLDRFIISLDGFSKEVFEKVRAGADHEKVYANVNRFLEIKRERGSHTPIVECQFSMMDENEHEAGAFREYWIGRGAQVKTREKLTWTGAVDAPNLSEQVRRHPCGWALRTCAIHWNGDMVACAVDYEGKFKAGNLENATIHGLWNTAHRRMERIHMERRWEDLPAPCRSCKDWQVSGTAQHNKPAVEPALAVAGV
ncbi:MAG: radical SAM protein [Planctomycetes bacterium]|nr:radical SAM protein [Planctomycetota bacterium]